MEEFKTIKADYIAELCVVLPRDLCGDIYKYIYDELLSNYIDDIYDNDIKNTEEAILNDALKHPHSDFIDLMEELYKTHDSKSVDIALSRYDSDEKKNIFGVIDELYKQRYNMCQPIDMIKYMSPDDYEQFKIVYFDINNFEADINTIIRYPSDFYVNTELYKYLVREILDEIAISPSFSRVFHKIAQSISQSLTNASSLKLLYNTDILEFTLQTLPGIIFQNIDTMKLFFTNVNRSRGPNSLHQLVLRYVPNLEILIDESMNEVVGDMLELEELQQKYSTYGW